jgi:hypothetical protein
MSVTSAVRGRPSALMIIETTSLDRVERRSLAEAHEAEHVPADQELHDLDRLHRSVQHASSDPLA